jgi:hypothetical protein
LFTKAIWLSLNGEMIVLRLKRSVRDLPDQALMVDALCTRTLV